MSDIIKVLVVDTGTVPLSYKKFEFPDVASSPVKQTILSAINTSGKKSHALIKRGKKYWVARHEEGKGPSEDYIKDEVTYHPLMKELN